MQSRFIKRVPIILFLPLMVLGHIPQDIAASSRLPIITSDMERPEFWIKKIKNPTNLLLTPEKIHKMNGENLKRQDLLLCRIRDLREEWKKEEILSFLKEDWENFGKKTEIRYGKSGRPLEEYFRNELRNKLSQESIKESSRMLFGLIVKRTDIRVFPTDELCQSNPHHEEFDLFQHSSISPGSPIGIYYFSEDGEWAYVQTPFIRGWIHTRDLAIAKKKEEVADYEGAQDRLVVTGSSINVFGDPHLRQSFFLAQMGDSFPVFSSPDGIKMANACYVIHVPCKEDSGPLTFRKGYIRADGEVHRGFLSYTQENVANQAFKMLNHPYGWGDRLGGRDCSRFIMDLFRTFGILMPRNSREQARVGMNLGRVEEKSSREKQKALDQAIPLATTLRMPGHIMLYLGKDRGRYYVIHSIWGIEVRGKAGPTVEKIGKAVVSDLSLGENGPNGSLLGRITDIRTIGSIPQIQKEK